MTLSDARDLSRGASSQCCPLNKLHVGTRLDRHACPLNRLHHHHNHHHRWPSLVTVLWFGGSLGQGLGIPGPTLGTKARCGRRRRFCATSSSLAPRLAPVICCSATAGRQDGSGRLSTASGGAVCTLVINFASVRLAGQFKEAFDDAKVRNKRAHLPVIPEHSHEPLLAARCSVSWRRLRITGCGFFWEVTSGDVSVFIISFAPQWIHAHASVSGVAQFARFST